LDDKECREEIEDKVHKIDHWLTVFGMTLDEDPLIDKKDPFEVGLEGDSGASATSPPIFLDSRCSRQGGSVSQPCRMRRTRTNGRNVCRS